MMKIIKYKKGSKGLYKVELDDGRSLALYEEVILKFNLLLTKEILETDLSDIEKYNLECDVYYVALNSLKSRFKSVYDTKEYLLKKEYPLDLVEMAVDKLVSQGYLNDRSYAKGFINNKMVTSNMGPNKIRKELLEHKISLDIINEEFFCLEGEGICPPEDCGGVGGYLYALEVLSNPEDDEYEHMIEWLGIDDVSELQVDFDKDEVNKYLKRMKQLRELRKR